MFQIKYVSYYSFNEEELSLDDMLSGSSAYMKEDLLKRKFVDTWQKLCHVVGIPPEIEIVHDNGNMYSETPYPEINRRVQRLLRRDEFPDYFDICELVERCNTKYDLGIGAEEKSQLSRKVFKSVGAILKARRQKDFKQHFGSHLTDFLKDSEDPALQDDGLLDQLKTSVKEGQEKLEKLCDDFVFKQEQDSDAGKSPEGDSCNTDNEEEEEEGEEEEEQVTLEIDELNDDNFELSEPPLKKSKHVSSEDQADSPLLPTEDDKETEDGLDEATSSNQPNKATSLASSSNSSFIDVESNSQEGSNNPPAEESSPPIICLSDSDDDDRNNNDDDDDSDVVIVSD